MGWLRRVILKCVRRVALTSTPVDNSTLDCCSSSLATAAFLDDHALAACMLRSVGRKRGCSTCWSQLEMFLTFWVRNTNTAATKFPMAPISKPAMRAAKNKRPARDHTRSLSVLTTASRCIRYSTCTFATMTKPNSKGMNAKCVARKRSSHARHSFICCDCTAFLFSRNSIFRVE